MVAAAADLVTSRAAASSVAAAARHKSLSVVARGARLGARLSVVGEPPGLPRWRRRERTQRRQGVTRAATVRSYSSRYYQSLQVAPVLGNTGVQMPGLSLTPYL